MSETLEILLALGLRQPFSSVLVYPFSILLREHFILNI